MRTLIVKQSVKFRKRNLTTVCRHYWCIIRSSKATVWPPRWYSGMAPQISALLSFIRAPMCTGPLSRVRANYHGAGVKFKHILTSGSPQLGRKPATSVHRGHITVRAEKFSTTTTAALWKSSQGNGSSSAQGRRGWLGKVAFGAALGVSTVALVQCLHTGTFTAMALKVNLNSDEGDWKETKGETVHPSPKGLFNVTTVTLPCSTPLQQKRVQSHDQNTCSAVSHWLAIQIH